jgi:hypothetical protein
MSDNHGNTPAAWTAVAVALVGFLVGAVGLMLSPLNYVVFGIGMGIVAVSGIVFGVMAKMGLNTEH